MSGLFGTFNIAKRGLFAQQRSIDVTTHNISNANTDGYSRQRVELQASRPFPMPNMNNAVGPGQLGTGVDVVSINRIRDNFLDYQVRVEMGIDGQFRGRDKFLREVENIFNEPTDTGISSLIGKFFDSWNTLATAPKESNARSIVAEQSLALTNELNHTYSELKSLKENTQMVIKDSVFEINGTLNQLNQLNQQIKQVKVAGNNPNDLMDRRDLLIDELSSRFGVTVDKTSYEGINITTSNEAKYASEGDNGKAPLGPKGLPLNLVQSLNPDETATFSYVSSIKAAPGDADADGKKTYEVTYYKKGDISTDNNKVTLNVKMTEAEYKNLDECRVVWANHDGVALKVDSGKATSLRNDDNLDKSNPPKEVEFKDLALFKAPSGELKGYMSVQEDINKQQEQINKFAKAIAFAVNGTMSQSAGWKGDNLTDGSEGGINNFFVNGKPGTAGAYTAADEAGITAENITINAEILKNPMLIKTALKYDAKGNPITGESDGNRALAVQILRDKLMTVQEIDRNTTREEFLNKVFKQNDAIGNLYTVENNTGGMTLDSYFKDTVDKLGIQEQEARRMVGNQKKLLAGFKESRDSVSGVSLDEEMTNLIQFQHCYQANAKVISTVDQLLDVVINGLKR